MSGLAEEHTLHRIWEELVSLNAKMLTLVPTNTANIGKVYDTLTGTYKGLRFNAEAPQVCAQDYLQAIAEGDVIGHTLFEKFGTAPAAPASAIDVWGANIAYVFPTAAMQMEVYSSSPNDNAAGSGVKTVTVYYLKNDYTEAEVDVVLTGTTPALTSVSDIFRVNALRVKNFGATNIAYVAAGIIDLRHTADTPIYSRIVAGNTRARNSIYTVPHGKTLYVVDMTAGVTKPTAAGNAALFTLRATYNNKNGALLTAGLFFMPFAEINHQDGFTQRDFRSPLKFPAHTDIKVSCTAGQASTLATASYRGWLE